MVIAKVLLWVRQSSRLKLLSSFFLILAICFALSTLVVKNGSCARASVPAIREAFDPRMGRIQSVDEAVNYIRARHPGAKPIEIAGAADALVRNRFFHGYSTYRPCQDWIAYLAGFLWYDLKSPVLPDDILKFRRAACSQQSIVFQQIVKRFGLDYASVRVPGHFASAVKLDGTWYVYDADREIAPTKFPFSALASGAPLIEQIYGGRGKALRAAPRSQIRLTDINGYPAPRAALFHMLTRFFSAYGWLVFGGIFALLQLAAIALRHPRRLALRNADGALPRPSKRST